MSHKITVNPYEVLGLERGCTDKDVQKAYKQQCLKWHPDKNLDNKEEAEKRFIAAKEAFHFLFDRIRREEYDRSYEKAKQKEAYQKARLHKADIARRKLIDDLYERERLSASGRNAEENLTPAQSHKKRKDEESRIRSEFEALRQRLEKEAADEIHAQQERIARLVRERTEVKTNQESLGCGFCFNNVIVEKHSTLRVSWKPTDDSDYDEIRLRNIYEKYGGISTITPIRTTKKGGRVCVIEFDVNQEGLNAESEIGKDGPEISGSWIIPPQTPTDGNSEDVPNTEKQKDYSSMTYEELQAQLFADASPPREKRKKWHEEE